MQENKLNGINQNLKYIYIIAGILLFILSYLFGFTKYKEKNSDLKDEIDSKQAVYEKYCEKNKNREKYITDKKTKEEEFQKILENFDGGITAEGIILECNNLSKTIPNLKISNIQLNGFDGNVYKFGQIDSLDPDNPGKTGVSSKLNFSAYKASYIITSSGTYDQIKQEIFDILSAKGKRKSISDIQFKIDESNNKIDAVITVNEYVIFGDGRTALPTPDYTESPVGTPNIFFK